MALVTVASDRALQGADNAIAHILPKLRVRKVISGKQRCNCLRKLFLFEYPLDMESLVSCRSHLVDVHIVYCAIGITIILRLSVASSSLLLLLLLVLLLLFRPQHSYASVYVDLI